MANFKFFNAPDDPVTEAPWEPAAETSATNMPPAHDATPTPAAPYRDSDEHLWHALSWVDQLVRAQTQRWRHTIAATKLEQFWGMVHVTDQEVGRFLAAPFMRADEMPADLADALRGYWRGAEGIAARMAQRRARTPDPCALRLYRLEALFRLSPLEVAVVLVCLLPELDSRYRRLYGYLQDDASRMRPNVDLVLQILQPLAMPGHGARSVFNEAAPLRAHRLIHVTDTAGGNDPLSARALHLDARVVDFLLGGDQGDDRLAGALHDVVPATRFTDLVMEEEAQARLQALATWLATASPAELEPLRPAMLLHGNYGSGRLAVASALCGELGLPLLRMDTRAALRAPGGWSLAVDLALREARLRGAALYWTDTQVLRQREQPRDHWDYLLAALEHHPGLVFFASDTPWDPAGHLHAKGYLRIDCPAPGYDLRRRLWDKHLPPPGAYAAPVPERAALTAALANGFQLTGGQIRDAVATARGQAVRRDPLSPRLTLDDLFEGCRRQSSRGLITFARLIEPRTDLRFEDLVLPASNRRQLDELRDRIRYRSRVYTGMGFERRLSLGRGLIALFTGASGTGKTLAAELLGREYGMQVFKVDLAAVVSKYVGETEKNLSLIFNEAEDANAILLFDEGEALFGKRGEVKEARDRWANTEVNYLLQRIEEFRGVVIITTNFRQNMDAAFLRRIHVSVDFPRPDAAARLQLWRGMFPPGIHRPGDDELSVLAAQFTLAGGNIKNIVVDAAFRAVADAQDGVASVTLRHLILGIAREEQKLGKALTRGDFGDRFYAWVEHEIL